MFSQSIPSTSDLDKFHKFLILGGGSSGDSSAKLLTSQGKICLLADKFPEKANSNLYTEVLSDNHPQIILDGIDCIIKSPGILPNHPILIEATKRQIPILSEICLGRIFYKGPIIGITGTDGKSTTTALTYHILKSKFPNAKMGGNIGVPLTSFCLEPLDLVVLELSSYQLDDSPNLRLTSSAILNLASDHLERHKTMESYAKAKWKIQDLENPNHKLFVNPNFFQFFTSENKQKENLHLIGENQKYFVSLEPNFVHTPNHSYDVSKFPLKGKHNLMNLCFAIALSESMGMNSNEIQNSFESFTGLPHRFRKIDSSKFPNPYKEIQFINDSKSTNLHSMLSGISGFKNGNELFLILGGIPKTEPIEPFLERWKELECPVWVYGKAVEVWKSEFDKTGLPVFYFPDLPSLLKDLKNKIDNTIFHTNTVDSPVITKKKKGPNSLSVIFSPAGASFDLYKNFEDRGNHFESLIHQFFV
ncbi:UDP-N-acetylmuramoyl-L-alanine--D-glutamate ligase [Leptospira sp. 2 VSF19]|uniref:UDP-N-acetylmuramoylalanine--D-glutamate ligase n=1 Tax=Leptospira soteropolitanensis TaxID=2950025 RepID=A0AAW5VPY0_9LEPT|nr:UDP-N-acetylmuramoyl-L-alanine--D-glutamate ligase [Leptospira soteropolitanensis]MCW7494523.1 UDP-N-acetylmuramoyl-L-alanine--D-glutamate ligase [Leptospira soteropolitanensis]MCW7502117.1 UDP-N-acetylmuramoyl-L-alanine--D-glutamate ligase [Leptospira soteropolitanensis]MCW7524369.1 UDP-N-acetylmuramoyl-L-alanine--D-glutamate ligase [Leptospira soteropolitanensis]MCW7528235.1 UDP-N-acetylmuramoyl-L-alanine--D-glutamate ligase [Leptospira soteropolitanensis]MCW7532087.1 UDP-N-acetylmuramoyl